MIEIVEVAPAHPLFTALGDLRQAVLRTPLGMVFTPEELAGEPGDINLAACEDGRVVGSLLLRRIDEQAMEIKRMAVADGQQGKGVGRLLVEYGERLAQAAGRRRMTMHARTSARNFYERLGYRTAGKEFLQSTIPHIVMDKDLTAA